MNINTVSAQRTIAQRINARGERRVRSRLPERCSGGRGMIGLRRAGEQHCLRSGGQNLWLTFYPGLSSDPLANGFGAVRALNEGMLRPEGNMLTYPRRGPELITYVIEGTLSHQDRGRRSKVMVAGELQCSWLADTGRWQHGVAGWEAGCRAHGAPSHAASLPRRAIVHAGATLAAQIAGS